MENLIKLLEIILLMNDNVSKADLMLKDKFSATDINKAEKILNYINGLN
jgi:hypothetical protein